MSLSKTQAVREVKHNMPDGQRVIFCREDIYIIDAAEKILSKSPMPRELELMPSMEEN